MMHCGHMEQCLPNESFIYRIYAHHMMSSYSQATALTLL
jgi:hypothetical protein